MTIIVSSAETSFLDEDISGSLISSNESVYRYPYPTPAGVRTEYLNKCVDTVTSTWVFWKTFYPDSTGVYYPGSGFSSSTYKVQTIIYSREQG
ncbi:MAG: hypothetical protein GWN00_08745 [Aliifodinibius sp.]|nr:hypothetical protein [Fodinibius sp.]NIY24889.1 hypothetical protein [Fodinibius sp.]